MTTACLYAFVSEGTTWGEVLVLAPLTFIALLPVCGVLYLIYLPLTLPMRRNERARLFLDLLELSLKEGQSPELAILSVAATRDPALGKGFHVRVLADSLEKGMTLSEALGRAPQSLPPQIIAMLRVGERIGDIAKVLPACRRLLNDGVSQVRGALNYLMILTFVVSPFAILVPLMVNRVIVPKFKEIFLDMTGGDELPAFCRLVLDHGTAIICVQLAFLALIWLIILAYAQGLPFHAAAQRSLSRLTDRFGFLLPWRRKRLQRDFSGMLSVLLDSEVPEIDAVALAAEATNHTLVRQRAAEVCARLRNGIKLPVAIQGMDDSGELSWRLANALQRGRGFLAALTGWHEALDAKAFQLEQAAAQTTTSAVVLFNGAVVGAVVIAIFLALISILTSVALW